MHRLLTIGIVLISATLSLSVDRPLRALSVEQIGAAIEWGTREEPKPYRIKTVIGGAKTGMGVVYTPYVLVALAAHAAAQAGSRLSIGDIAPRSIEPMFYVVITDVGEEGAESVESRHIELLPSRSSELIGSKESERPLWISQHPASDGLLKHIDAPEGSVIAAFDLAQLGLRRFLVSYRWDSESARNAVNIIWGEIPEEKLSH